jgi:hypothetical protein
MEFHKKMMNEDIQGFDPQNSLFSIINEVGWSLLPLHAKKRQNKIKTQF